MPTQKINKISDNFRQSAAGVKLGRALFDPGLQGNISPLQIASLLKQAGIPIPNEVSIGIQTAQMIMSGGTLISNIASGTSSLLQIGQASASYISAAIALMRTIGLIDGDSVLMRSVQMGIDGGLVVSSSGVNVAADFALVMDVTAAVFFPPDERPQVTQSLDRLNRQNARNFVISRTKAQTIAAHNLISDYQDKKISMFEFVGEFALQSGDAFPNYFPEYKAFIPPHILTASFAQTGEAAHGGFLFVGRESDVIRRVLNVDISTTSYTTRREVVRSFVQKFITDPFAPYLMLNSEGISFAALACLSVLSDDFDYVPENFDIIPTLQKLMLMPSDLSFSDFLFSQMGSTAKNSFIDQYTYNAVKNEAYAQSGISYNGMPLDNKAAAQNYQVALDNYSRTLALKCEAEGDILRLTKIPLVRDILRKWGNLPKLSPEQISKLPNLYRITSAGDKTDYRNIQNFFSAVSLINVMDNDSWLNKNGDLADILQSVKWVLPAKDQMENYFEQIFNRSTARFINAKARANVAQFFKTTPDKVDFKNNADGSAYIVPKGK